MAHRALLSVSEKTGIVALARRLAAAGYEILSTGGTREELLEAGVTVTAVEGVTGFPEIFGGRVKTLHPKILGGILMRRGEDEKEATKHGIEPIDVVVVNLYPFESGQGAGGRGQLIELIDIGGVTLLRAAAKNWKDVTVVCDIGDYDCVASEIERTGRTSQLTRRELSAKAFARTAAYDAVITRTLSEGHSDGVVLTNGMILRYGENPHQWGKYYDVAGAPHRWEIVQQEEKPISYLNILDADAAWGLVCEFDEPTAACIKHANPSGVASSDEISEAFQRSYDADRLSAFGVIIALNRTCTEEIIQKIIDQKIFAEVLIAPEFDENARKLLKERPKLRVIRCPCSDEPLVLYRSTLGGMLVQNADDSLVTEKTLTCVTSKKPTEEEISDLLFAWKVVKHAKSNAIVFAKDSVTVGIGCGQTSRVDAVHIAARRAKGNAKGAVMASDAFFPFADSIEEAAQHGIAAIIQPGGSIRDEEVITKANQLGIAMMFTGIRAFRH